MKRLILNLLLLVTIFLAVFPDAAIADASQHESSISEGRFEKGLLWEITRPGRASSYVFGTMHSEDPRVMTLPPSVQTSFDGSRSLTLEILPGPELRAASKMMFFTDEHTLASVAGERLYQEVVSAMAEYGLPDGIIVKMKPWAVFTMLSVPKPKSGIFLDMSLYRMALQNKMQTLALESVQEQLGIFDTLPMKEQVILMKKSLQDRHAISEQINTLTEAYLARDLKQLQEIGEKFAPRDDPIAKRLMQRLIDDRNLTMVKRMQPQLEEGGAFIAIGALHLPGRHGILALLAEKGYRVRVVY
ncbi:MAG: TraB/GumN family protein [Gammaproteobacteria bacterium]|nr:MAG: TraB/GumN family protein [Gammaproteobacteria bacterium]